MVIHQLQQVAVLDLLGGRLVAGQGGRRRSYRPIEEHWRLSQRTPRDWALTLNRELAIRQFYIADLDAIEGRDYQTGVRLAEELLDFGFSVWLDGGNGPHAATLHRHLKNRSGDYWAVCPTEGGGVRERTFGPWFGVPTAEQILSIDLQGTPQLFPSSLVTSGSQVGQHSLCDRSDLPAVSALKWYGSEETAKESDVLAVVQKAIQAGIRRVILLNLTDVGAEGNQMLPWLRQLQSKLPSVDWILGGGINPQRDHAHLAACECTTVLLGSWLWRQLAHAT